MKKIILIALCLALVLACGVLLLVGCDKGGEETTAPAGDPCAAGHSFGGEEIVTQPTCTKKGSAKRVCSVCGEEEKIELAATGHKKGDWVLVAEATCAVAGTKHQKCMICDAVLDTDYITALPHTFGDWTVTKEPTYTAQGSESRKCLACGETETRAVDKIFHEHTIGKVTLVEPTHTKAGSEKVYCGVCGQMTSNKPIAKITGCVWTEWAPAPDADIFCENTVTYTRRCTVKDCGATETKDVYIAHEYGDPVVIQAVSCENDGILEYTCLRSGCENTHRETVTTTGHDYKWETLSEQTCTTDGVRVFKCSKCEAVSKSETKTKLGHLSSAWQTVTEATCTAEGLRHKVCTREGCGAETQREVVAALGHSEVTWQIVTPATCTTAGLRRAKTMCTRCQQAGFEEKIEALGHTPGNEWVVVEEPKCGVNGWKAKKCTRCNGASDEGEYIEAPEHKFGEWSTPTATCLENGTKQRECGSCHFVETETVLALGHDFSGWKAATGDPSRVQCGRDGCNVTYAKEEYAYESGETKNVTLTGYPIVYGTGVSDAFKEKIEQLAKKLYELTGLEVKAYSTSSSTKVINVKTGSDAAITGHGFMIKYSSGTITIQGTTALITQMAVDYFMDHYLTGSTVTLPALAVSDEYEMITLSGYTPIYSASADSVAQEKESGSDYNNYYGVSSETGRDYVVDVALTLAAQQGTSASKDSSSATEKEILIGKTNREQSAEALSLLKGHEYGIMVIDGKLVLAGWGLPSLHMAGKIGESYLSDAVYGGQILLPANLRMIGEASDRWLTDEVLLPTNLPLYNTADDGEGAFQYMYRGSGVNKTAFDAYVTKLKGMGYVELTSSNAEGSYFVTLTDADRTQMLHISYEAYAHASDNTAGSEWKSSWGSDPAIRVVTAYVQEQYTTKSESLQEPSGCVKNSDDSSKTKTFKTYESGVTETYFLYTQKPTVLDAYRNKIVGKGYTLIFSDSASERYVLVNRSTGEWMEIFYSDRSITTGNETYTHSICRRHYAPGVITLPTAEILNPNQTYEKVTDTKIVSIDLSNVSGTSGSYGTGYVIMLEDGRFVIIDGGAADGGTSGDAAFAQVNNFWSIIEALYKDVYGKSPSSSNRVHIAAWIITHAHGDHMNMLWDFTHPNNAHRDKIRLDYVIANNPEFTMQYNTGEPGMTLTQQMTKLHERLTYGFTYLKVQTGQKYYFANLEIDTLFTQGNLAPQRIVTFNDVSTIQRLSFVRTADTYNVTRSYNHNSMAASTKSTFLSTGDAYVWGGRWTAAMFGSYLKTDMVSVSHHGGPGVTAEFYDLVAPRVVWWSMSKTSVYKSSTGYLASTAWYAKADQHLFFKVQSVDYVYIADDYHITLTLKAAGPDYDNIYHATDTNKTKLSYYSISKSTTSANYTLRNKKPVVIKKT